MGCKATPATDTPGRAKDTVSPLDGPQASVSCKPETVTWYPVPKVRPVADDSVTSRDRLGSAATETLTGVAVEPAVGSVTASPSTTSATPSDGPPAPPSGGTVGATRIPRCSTEASCHTASAAPAARSSIHGWSAVPVPVPAAPLPSNPGSTESRSASPVPPRATTELRNAATAPTGSATNAVADSTGQVASPVRLAGGVSPMSTLIAVPAAPSPPSMPATTASRACAPTSASASGEVRSSTSWWCRREASWPTSTRSAPSTKTGLRPSSSASPACRAPTVTTAGEDTETIVPLSPPYRAVRDSSGSARTPGCAPSWIRASDAATATETSGTEDPPSAVATLSDRPGVSTRSPPSLTATSTVRSTAARPTERLMPYGGPPDATVAPARSASSPIHACMADGVVASDCSHCRSAGSPSARMPATGSGGIAPPDGSRPNIPSTSRAAPVADAASACSTAVSRWASSGPMALAESSEISSGWLLPGSISPCTTTPTTGVPDRWPPDTVSGTNAVSPTLFSTASATVTVADKAAVASATSPGSAESRPGRNTTPEPWLTRSSGTRISASTEAGEAAAIRTPIDTTVPRPFGSSTANRFTAAVSPNNGTQVRPGSSVTGSA